MRVELSRYGLAPLALRTSGRAAGTFVPEDDAPLVEVVRRHFDANPVAHDRPDAKLAHLAGRVGDDPMVVLQHDAEATIGEDFVDLAFEGQKILFGHRVKPIRDRLPKS